MNVKVHVVAPVHNRSAITEEFARNLLAQRYENWHLLLVDDGSVDGTEDTVRALVPDAKITVLKGVGNWWWGGSLHQAYLWLKRHSGGDDIVVIMNDDTEFDPDFLTKGVEALKPGSLLLAQLYDRRGAFEEIGVRWDWAKLLCHSVTEGEGANCFSTRGLFIHAQDFIALGGFYPTILPHYLSDYEFSIRAHRRGYRLVSSPGVHLRYNDSAALTGVRSISGLSVFQSLKANLSIRSTANPIYWSSFVLLASPRRYLPRNLVRVWWRFLGPVRDKVGLTVITPVRRLLAPVRSFLGRVKRKIKREWTARTGPAP